MPRPNTHMFTAMLILIMAAMDIVSVSADPSASATSFLSRTKRQSFGRSHHRIDEDFVTDPSETCALAGISYFCYSNYCARDCGIPGRNASDPRASRYKWCYTTRGATGDQNFFACKTDADCSPIMGCATPCEAKPNKPEVSPCAGYGCDAGECWSSCNYKKLDRAICYTRNAQEAGTIKCTSDQECVPKVNYRCFDKCKAN